LTDRQSTTPPHRGATALLEAMRPQHWIKNGFVAAPLLFAGLFTSLTAWAESLAAVASFCLLASAVYLVNDICDRRSDRAHPVKRHRPIAEGRLSVDLAAAAAVVLALAGAALVAGVTWYVYDPSAPLGGWGLPVWTGAYLVLNLLYSFWLKKRAIVDVIVVAMGFVLRAMAGAAAIAVPVSPWLVVCTLTLCLFIAIAKRRSELGEVSGEQLAAARVASRGYDRETLEHMLTVSAALAILTYSLYCLAPRTVKHIGSGHMVWTIPLVIYGTFRYYRNTQRAAASDAVALLVRDKVMWIVLAAYAVLCAIIIQYGSAPAVKDILDV